VDDVHDAHDMMADPSYWAGFAGGILCAYCPAPLTEKNGTRARVGEAEDGTPIYEHLCVTCLISGGPTDGKHQVA
jgi:hypothetical protein